MRAVQPVPLKLSLQATPLYCCLTNQAVYLQVLVVEDWQVFFRFGFLVRTPSQSPGLSEKKNSTERSSPFKLPTETEGAFFVCVIVILLLAVLDAVPIAQ